jgi:energy-coupling factor transporter ATP-binding protein EcfA2
LRLSPQSQAIVDALLGGESRASGSVALGPLDATTKIVLGIIVDDYGEIDDLRGVDRAKDFLNRYRARVTKDQEEIENGETALTEEDAERPDDETVGTTPRGWRLIELKASSFRGLAPPGDEIEFPFDGKSTLIFGSNGTGKSSLLGAVVWVLANQTITDADTDDENAAVYENSDGTEFGKKIRQWRINQTLPDSDIAKATADGWAALRIQSSDGKETKWLRRKQPEELEQSDDGETWIPCNDLTHLGIQPLDLELSLIAPMIFGRQTIDQAEESKDILQLMLGLDDIVNIGTLAGNVATNRTRLETTERTQIEEELKSISGELKKLSNQLNADLKSASPLSSLAAKTSPSEESIKQVGTVINSEIEEKEKSIAEAIGLQAYDKDKAEGIADKLTVAVAALEADIAEMFPMFAQIFLPSVLPKTDFESSEDRLITLGQSLDEFVADARTSIAKRLDWWRKESQPGSRWGLKLLAAQHYDTNKQDCSVCDQSVAHLPIKDVLADLKTFPPELRREVDAYFRDHCDGLDQIVAPAIRSISDTQPNDRVTQDWNHLKEKFDPIFADLIEQFDDLITAISNDCSPLEAAPSNLLADGIEAGFSILANAFVTQVASAQKTLTFLVWSSEHYEDIENRIQNVLSRDSTEESPTLRGILLKGKAAADNIKDLERVRDELRKLYVRRQAVSAKEFDVADLVKLKKPLETLKKLTKFSENEVERIFGDIAEATGKNWQKLYPETPTTLNPGGLVKSSRGQIDAMLSGPNYRVLSKFFANSGLQRAIALAFYFALLENHPGGLGFVLLDDSILSLDNEHRENWSADILNPCMDVLQIIFATHQGEYVRNCRQDFSGGQVIELNRRDKGRRISWRPGNLLEKAEFELEEDYKRVPIILRMYREGLLLSFDAYSPTLFFDRRNLTNSFNTFAGLVSPHPLASKNQRRIVSILRDPDVTRVLDPGSHTLTESDVTAPMIRRCLEKLRKCDKWADTELGRLDDIRRPGRQARQLPIGNVVTFPGLPPSAIRKKPIEIKEIGCAAAKPDSVTIDTSEQPVIVKLAGGSTVRVCSHTFDPIAKLGQWVMLAADDISIADGDLAAMEIPGGRRLLRRIWTEGESWRMQSINPVELNPIVSVLKSECAARKVIGVLFEPRKFPEDEIDPELTEWDFVDVETSKLLHELRCITVEGSSLDPIARNGERVLVAKGQPPNETTMSNGSLAVVETTNEKVGNVIKRVFRMDDGFILVSPNPVEPHEPIPLNREEVSLLWPLRGMLFEQTEPE